MTRWTVCNSASHIAKSPSTTDCHRFQRRPPVFTPLWLTISDVPFFVFAFDALSRIPLGRIE
jgi:hypothetical protein